MSTIETVDQFDPATIQTVDDAFGLMFRCIECTMAERIHAVLSSAIAEHREAKAVTAGPVVDETMVEAAAIALCEEMRVDPSCTDEDGEPVFASWDECVEVTRTAWRNQARNVLTAALAAVSS